MGKAKAISGPDRADAFSTLSRQMPAMAAAGVFALSKSVWFNAGLAAKFVV